MKKLSTALTAGLVALIAVGCNNANDTSKTRLAPQTTPEAQDTVLAELEGVDDHSDNPSEVLNPPANSTRLKHPYKTSPR